MRHWYPTLRIRKQSCYKAMDIFAETFWRLRSLHLDYKRTHLTKQLTNPPPLFQQTRQQRTWITSHINEPSSAMHLPNCRSTSNDKPMKPIYIFDNKILQNAHVRTLDSAYYTPTQIHVVQPSMEQLSNPSKFPWTLVCWKHYRQLKKDQEYNIGKITYLQRVGFAHQVNTSFLPLEYLEVLRSHGRVLQVRMQ